MCDTGGSTGLFCRAELKPVPLLNSDMESLPPYSDAVVRTALSRACAEGCDDLISACDVIRLGGVAAGGNDS